MRVLSKHVHLKALNFSQELESLLSEALGGGESLVCNLFMLVFLLIDASTLMIDVFTSQLLAPLLDMLLMDLFWSFESLSELAVEAVENKTSEKKSDQKEGGDGEESDTEEQNSKSVLPADTVNRMRVCVSL